MQLRWALLLGLVAGVAVAWWLSRDTPEQAREKRARAEQAAAADYEDSRPVLSRWRDDGGALPVTDTAPKGRQYERLPKNRNDGVSGKDVAVRVDTGCCPILQK